MADFQNLTWKEAGERLARGLVLILPVGSTEAHGPHLPLATDVIISEEMSRRAVAKLATRGIEAMALPAIAYSVTDFSADFAGSISVRRETAAALIADICVSLYKQGARLVVIANSHLEPEHIESIGEAIGRVRRETGRDVAFPDKRRRRWAETLTEEFRRGDCHAGSYETSLVMAARPELVREDVRKGLARMPVSIAEKIREGVRTFNEAGGSEAYFGEPSAASREEGEASFEALSDMIVASVIESLEASGKSKDITE
jgi:creatinine amidohydrolase